MAPEGGEEKKKKKKRAKFHHTCIHLCFNHAKRLCMYQQYNICVCFSLLRKLQCELSVKFPTKSFSGPLTFVKSVNNCFSSLLLFSFQVKAWQLKTSLTNTTWLKSSFHKWSFRTNFEWMVRKFFNTISHQLVNELLWIRIRKKFHSQR